MPTAPRYFYPRSPCGERLCTDICRRNGIKISIHALLAESDGRHGRPCDRPSRRFLSTLSLRRATGIADAVALALDISIHALLAESDTSIRCSLNHYLAFLSTLSLRRATRWQRGVSCYDGISIHALLTESDDGFEGCQQLIGDISIHALLTESDHHQSDYLYLGQQFLSTLSLRRATQQLKVVLALQIFLSTLSLRRATHPGTKCDPRWLISIHALLTESDGAVLKLQCILGNFYPRSPYGERR